MMCLLEAHQVQPPKVQMGLKSGCTVQMDCPAEIDIIQIMEIQNSTPMCHMIPIGDIMKTVNGLLEPGILLRLAH